MHRHLYVITLLSLFVAAGCGKKDESSEEPPAEAPPASKVAAEEPEPVKATFSPEAAAKLTGELASCKSAYSCDALKQLIEFGAPASAGLLEIAIDASKPKELRRVAIHGLTEIKDPAAGVKLFEAGKVEKDFITRGDLFKAAGASGGDEAFDAMIAHYAGDESKEHRTELGFGVKKFDKAKVFAYASANYPDDPKQQVRFANLVREAATDAAQIEPLLAKTKHQMARHRLASKMVALGDTSKLEVLYAGLAAKDVYDRSDAGNMLADVADKIPADKKAEVIDLAKKAKAGDRGGLTSRGYDKILKALGANSTAR